MCDDVDVDDDGMMSGGNGCFVIGGCGGCGGDGSKVLVLVVVISLFMFPLVSLWLLSPLLSLLLSLHLLVQSSPSSLALLCILSTVFVVELFTLFKSSTF